MACAIVNPALGAAEFAEPWAFWKSPAKIDCQRHS